MEDKRLFSEDEATQLILEAARIQESGPGSSEYKPGVSFVELKRMANDLGVQEEYLHQALAGLRPGEKATDAAKRFMGFPISLEFERVIDGELPPENFDIVAQEIAPVAYANVGQQAITQVGRGLTAKFMQGLVTGTVSVQSRHGRTRVKAQCRNELGVTFGVLGPAIGLMIGLVPIAVKAPGAGPMVLLAWTLLTLAWLFVFAKGSEVSFAKTKARVEKIVDTIGEENGDLAANLASASAGAGIAETAEVEAHE